MSNQKLKTQPGIELGELTQAVTSAIRSALEQRVSSANTAKVFKNPRIIIGVILEAAGGEQSE
jgi:hypothetical protein